MTGSESLWQIFINASLVNNFVLAYFLGICPFLGVSGKMETASKMGAAVTFVMIISSVCAYGIHLLLVAVNAPFLQLISYIVVIASTVQLVEMFIKKMSPSLFPIAGDISSAHYDQLRHFGGSLIPNQQGIRIFGKFYICLRRWRRIYISPGAYCRIARTIGLRRSTKCS